MENFSKIVEKVKEKFTWLWRSVAWWFMLHFLNKKIKEIRARRFKFEFRKYTVSIKTDNDFWSIRFRSDFIASPMLFCLAEKNDLDALFGYVVALYHTSNFLCTDQGFVDGLEREMNKYVKRMEKRAEKAAANVTDEQEAGDDALMREAVKYNKKDKTNREKDRDIMRQVVSELKNKQ
jgi:hypothetical protein